MLAWDQRQAVQIGQNIRNRRKELGKSQTYLADGLLSVQSVSLIERGKLKVTPETLAVFAERLACEVDDLLIMHNLHDDWLEDMLQDAIRHKDRQQDGKAIELLHTLYTESLMKSNTHYLLQSAFHLCLLYNKTAKYAISNEWGIESLRYLDQDKHLEQLMSVYVTIGNNYYVLGNMWQAYDLLSEAEKLIDHRLKYSLQAGKIYYSMAILKQIQKNWEGCLWYSERALQVFDEHNVTIHIGRTLMMMGTAFKNQERYDKALLHLERSIRILSQTSDIASLGRCYHNLGELELKMDLPDKARKSFARSLRIKRQANDLGSITNTLRGLAKIAMQSGDYVEAEQYLQECWEQSEQLESDLQRAITRRTLGDLSLARGDVGEFLNQYTLAIETFERLGFSTELAESAEKLGDYYLQHGDTKRAAAHLQTATRHYRKLLERT
ncbi:MAG TPA: helix-turn-helix transcriptional regulator [Bacilli bacterium]|nr:helix-turn-helix transcriptional regulator [Bacilli bacterium]